MIGRPWSRGFRPFGQSRPDARTPGGRPGPRRAGPRTHVRPEHRVELFKQMEMLLSSGVLISDALARLKERYPDARTRRVLHEVHDAYDMHHHTRAGSPQSAHLTEQFVDRFAVVGPPEHCIDRLSELAALGVDKFVVVGPSIDADREEAQRAGQRFADEVLPALKAL